jgi:hypothetical protein
MKAGILVLIFTFLVRNSVTFEIALDTQEDAKFWKIRGNYVYASSLRDGGRLTPGMRSSGSNATTKGVWYLKYAPLTEHNDNTLEMTFTLKHSLFQEVWVRMLAHPSVSVRIQNKPNQELGLFHSNGTAWCDAVISNQLEKSFTLRVNLTEPGTYVMIDKVVVGITKIKDLKTADLNPCLGSFESPEQNSQSENWESLMVFDTTTMPPPIMSSEVLNVVDKSRLTGEFGSPLARAARNIIPTETTTTSSIDDATCSCSCTCSKPSD